MELSTNEYSLASIIASIEKFQNVLPTSKKLKSLTVFLWNVNSIKHILRKPAFFEFIKKYSPDILCLVETKTIFCEHEKLRKIFSYPYQYWSSAASHVTGVSILSDIEAISVSHGLNFHSQGRVLTLEFQDFYLCVCYCPLSKTENEITQRILWDQELRNYISGLKTRKKVIWAGDFNIIPEDIDIDIAYENILGASKDLRNSYQLNLKLGFLDSFRKFHRNEKKYTWRSIRTPGLSSAKVWKTRIDFILLDNQWEECLIEASIYENFKSVSDHCPVGIKLSF